MTLEEKMKLCDKNNIVVKFITNSFDNEERFEVLGRVSEIDIEEIEDDSPDFGNYSICDEYDIEVGEDLSEEEAGFMEGYNSDYEDFDSSETEVISLIDYMYSDEEAKMAIKDIKRQVEIRDKMCDCSDEEYEELNDELEGLVEDYGVYETEVEYDSNMVYINALDDCGSFKIGEIYNDMSHDGIVFLGKIEEDMI